MAGELQLKVLRPTANRKIVASGGSKTRLGHFTVDNLYRMLTNPLYVGQRRFMAKGEERMVKACWDGIVDEMTFRRVQDGLAINFRRNKSARKDRYPYTLTGRVFCAQCGDRLTGKSAHGNGGKIGYYEHSWATKRQSCSREKVFACQPHRIAAKRLEAAVWDEIGKLLRSTEVAQSLIKQAHKEHRSQGPVMETDKLRAKAREAEEQIEALAEHLAKIPKGVSPAPIFAQMQKLEERKADAMKELDDLTRGGTRSDEPVGPKDYQEFLSALRTLLELSDSVEFKSNLVKWLVARIEVLPSSLRMHFYVGKNQIIPFKWEQLNAQGVAKNGDAETSGNYPTGKTRQFFCVGGSNTVANGVGDGN